MNEEPTTTCMSGPKCKSHDGRTAYPTTNPLCDACLDTAHHDITALVYDYLDLAQLHEGSLSQAINDTTRGGSGEAPMPIVAHVEALQAEMVYVTCLWEFEVRTAHRLHNPQTFTALWRSTVYDTINLPAHEIVRRRARPGRLIQCAVATITPRLQLLSQLPAALVCATGVEDPPAEMFGWQAVHQLADLHHKSRTALGRTVRKFWIPGECWSCPARPTPGVDGPLYRSEPTQYADPMHVCCARCAATRPYADYEIYQGSLLWPEQPGDHTTPGVHR